LGNVTDYRHDEATRKNNPPAKIAAEGTVPIMPKIKYEYSPRLTPVLRFDSTGQADKLPELLQKAQRHPLTLAEATQLELSLSWVFVIQSNQKPSHDTFLTEVSSFFDQKTAPRVRRDRACLLFANSAGKPTPGKANEYGNTSLVFPPQTLFKQTYCSPTFSNGGPRFRSSTLLSAYRDFVFRERGACIHSFLQVNPNSLSAGAAGRTIAIENAFVFPLDGTIDRRVPSDPVRSFPLYRL
jgi:hypothetical protein